MVSRPLDPAMQAYIDNNQRFAPRDDSLAARREADARAGRGTDDGGGRVDEVIGRLRA